MRRALNPKNACVWMFVFSATGSRANEPRLTAELLSGSTVVARVNGQEIRYDAIRVNREDIAARLASSSSATGGVEPAAPEEVAELRLRYERRRLARAIRHAIREEQVKKLGIIVTGAEIRDRWEQLKSEADVPRVEERWQRKYTLLLEGLDSVYDEATDPNVVFDGFLSDQVTRAEWEAALRQFRRPRTRELLRQHLIKKQYEFADAQDAVRQIIVKEKVEKAIDDSIATHDPEYAAFLKLWRNRPLAEELGTYPRHYRLEAHRRWWEFRYGRARIADVHPAFQSVADEFRK